jgi:hypothetical protein
LLWLWFTFNYTVFGYYLDYLCILFHGIGIWEPCCPLVWATQTHS